MREIARLLLTVMLVPLLAMSFLPPQTSLAAYDSSYQNDPLQQRAQDLLARMTPEERVGQLFVVTFNGPKIDEKSQVNDLIVNQHIGGLVLMRANDNFSNVEDIRQQTYNLINTLQNTELVASQTSETNPGSSETFNPQYVPLFIGISQEGNSFPNDQLLSGVTSMPDLMAIGATWDPTLAQQAGTIMGQEMWDLGFNLFLGPSLDVLFDSPSQSGSYLGARPFGGDPYWVSKMGEAYISGLHKGSNGHLAVIAKDFPGGGSSDRSPEEEIATVRKSLDELRQIDLAPFFAVTGKAPSLDSTSDGLLVSHIRYQGFQSNIRATTRPVSLDTAALDLILKQPELATWRQNGGVMVSDDLGSPALRRFYETTGVFDPLQAAREAFYAGNDLLFLNHFVGSGDPDAYATIVRTLQFFAQKYRTDPEFARRVDAAVLRILTLKYRLYPTFDFSQVMPSVQAMSQVGNTSQALQVVRDVARQSVTLISPDTGELANVMPSPPGSRSRILFLTDLLTGQQCSTCKAEAPLDVDTLQKAVLNLYGPGATGQVSARMMSSYSFSDLSKMLNGDETDHALIDDLSSADWVVVSMLKPDPSLPESMAFIRLLTDQPRLLADKKVIVFAFDAPYYLDATDISKITAYYGLYSRTPAFVDIAARVLFQEITPSGAPPVSVPGVGYELIQATSPDPNQNIPLTIDTPGASPTLMTTLEATTTQTTPSLQTYGVKDIISLRTGVIYDRNHRPVPDDTPVTFLISVTTTTGTIPAQIPEFTVDGVARLSYRIDQAGLIEIHATSGGAVSQSFRLDVSRGQEAVPTIVVVPSLSPVPPTPTVTPSLTPTTTVTMTVSPTVTPTPEPTPVVAYTDWFFMALLVSGVTAGVSWFGIRREIARWGLRWALCGLIGGLLAYNYLAFGLPGTERLLKDMGTGGVLLVTFCGISAGWLAGLLWKQLSTRFPPSSPPGNDKSPAGERKTGPKS